MLTLQRFKTTVVFVALAVLLIGAVWVYARVSVYGYAADNDNVYWDVTVENLRRSGDSTYSSHQYYIENYRTTSVTLIEQEFKHRVMQTFPNDPGKSDAEEIAIRNADMTDTVRIPKKSSKRRYFTHEVDISDLDPGVYYINTYTRINLDDVTEDPTPKAEESSRNFRIQ